MSILYFLPDVSPVYDAIISSIVGVALAFIGYLYRDVTLWLSRIRLRRLFGRHAVSADSIKITVPSLALRERADSTGVPVHKIRGGSVIGTFFWTDGEELFASKDVYAAVEVANVFRDFFSDPIFPCGDNEDFDTSEKALVHIGLFSNNFSKEAIESCMSELSPRIIKNGSSRILVVKVGGRNG